MILRLGLRGKTKNDTEYAFSIIWIKPIICGVTHLLFMIEALTPNLHAAIRDKNPCQRSLGNIVMAN